MTFAFGVAKTYPELLASQFFAAVGAAAMWIGAMSWLIDVAPSERRGAVLGSMFSVTAAGEIVGPVVGGVAATAGRAATFASLAGVAVLLAGATFRSAPPRGAPEPLGIRTALGSPAFRAAAWLAVVPCLLLGALLLLGTLKLTDLGAGPGEIAAAFVVAAAVGVVQGPLVGHWSDREGRLRPIKVGMLAGIPVMLALAWTQSRAVVFVLLVLALITVRFSLSPAIALLFDAGESAGAGSLLPLATTMPVTAAGVAIGSAGSGALAQAAGSSWAYVAPAAISLVALAVLTVVTEIASSFVTNR